MLLHDNLGHPRCMTEMSIERKTLDIIEDKHGFPYIEGILEQGKTTTHKSSEDDSELFLAS